MPTIHILKLYTDVQGCFEVLHLCCVVVVFMCERWLVEKNWNSVLVLVWLDL